MKRIRKTKYPRVGEVVILERPMMFVRVGYPLTMQDLLMDEVQRKIIDKRTEQMEQALHYGRVLEEKMGEHVGPDYWLVMQGSKIDPRVRTMLEKAAALSLLIEKKFGGRERKLFETDCSEDKFSSTYGFVGAEWVVTKRKLAKTGRRYNGYSSEDDYEPPQLADEHTHCILSLRRLDLHWRFGPHRFFRTSSVHVKRLV